MLKLRNNLVTEHRFRSCSPLLPAGCSIMARSPRSEYLTPDESTSAFIICRSARTLLVTSCDRSDSTADGHRVDFIENLIRLFARYFCISVHSHAVLPNELRLVLGTHPHVVQTLDDAEVARRWLILCPTLRSTTPQSTTPQSTEPQSTEPTEHQIIAMCADTPNIAQIRLRLSDISWFMRLLQQRITLFCNRQDKLTGRLWTDRYRSVVLLGKVARLFAMANVDLGAVCIDPDKPFSISKFTSALLRLHDLQEAEKNNALPADSTNHSNADHSNADTTADAICQITKPNVNEADVGQCHLWSRHLAPLPFAGESPHTVAPSASFPPCSSDASATNLKPTEYFELLEWIRRSLDGVSAHSRPAWLSLLLRNIRLTAEALAAFIRNFDVLFSHVAGGPSMMDAFRTKSRRRKAWVTREARAWFQRCRQQFSAAPLF